MAIPEKRTLGTCAPWLGVLFFASLGLAVIPTSKLLRARECIGRVLGNGVEFQEYRALLGLLEHLRSVNLRGRNAMHGLYAPHGPTGASRLGPSGLVRPSANTNEGLLMRKQLQRWLDLALQSGGTSVKASLDRSLLEPAPTLHIVLDSDACHGDASVSGIDGFCHGMYFYFPVAEDDLPFVHTPMLEFLGVCFLILAFSRLAGNQLTDNVTVLLRTDALTAALTLPAESMGSPVLVLAYQFLNAQAAWRALLLRLAIKHLFGDGNPMSDAISRAKWAEFEARCRAVGISPMRVDLPQECLELYGLCVRFMRQQASTAGDSAPATERRSSSIECPTALFHCGCATTRPPPPPKWLLARLAASPSPAEPTPASEPTGAAPSGTTALALSRIAAAPDLTPAASSNAAPRNVGGILLPPEPPPPPLPKRTLPATARLAEAGRHYARQRLRAMATGGGDMAFTLDESTLAQLANSMQDGVEYGVNANTADTDQRAWLMWEHICEQHRTSPLRTAEEARERPERNAHLLAVLMLHAFVVCKPRTKASLFIKPKSALAYPLTIVRIFGRGPSPCPATSS